MAEAGLSFDGVTQLLLKTLHFSGELTGVELTRRLGLEFSVFEPVVDFLKAQHQCEIVGAAGVGAASYRYRITDAGRSRALLFLENNRYVGVAPVPLEQYRRYMEEYRSAAVRRATRDRIREAFAHLVIGSRVLDQLGPAINAGQSMFVYGPPGNGKTVISQAIRNLLDGDIAIPHALEVEGSLIRFFDPVNHEPLAVGTHEDSLTTDAKSDGRWIRCKRPMVTVGGELRLESLDLAYIPTGGFYRAPVQAVANGGVLVIDDFGRQQCSARELLNRWIVPLESRVDFLTLQTGQTFVMPFMTLVVFATNLKPSELVDEAFLRRIHYKIYAESPTAEEFITIIENCCRERNILFERPVVEELLRTFFRARHVPLRGCHPRDLIEQALGLAEYLGAPRRVTFELLESACASYFVEDREVEGVYA